MSVVQISQPRLTLPAWWLPHPKNYIVKRSKRSPIDLEASGGKQKLRQSAVKSASVLNPAQMSQGYVDLMVNS